MMSKYFLFALSTVAFSGCTAEQAYYGFQQSAKNECAKTVHQNDYAECMERASMSYEEYERKRKENSADGN